MRSHPSKGGSSFFGVMKTRVYIDGYNLYYGCLRNSPYKWLNLLLFCKSILGKKCTIEKLKYFTAKIKDRPEDPNQSVRQDMYLSALETVPEIEIILGRFFQHPARMALEENPRKKVKVIKTEEKGSDVNLAVHLVRDGFLGLYDQALVVSNDSDLCEAIRVVREDLNKPVIVLFPAFDGQHCGGSKRTISYHLKQVASGVRFVRESNLKNAQFPEHIQYVGAEIRKPVEWR